VDEKKNFGQRLAEARKRKGLTQEWIAKATDVSKQNVSSWERGIIYPSVDKLAVLGRLLQASLDHLVGGNDITPSSSGQPPEALEVPVMGTLQSRSFREKALEPTGETVVVPRERLITDFALKVVDDHAGAAAPRDSVVSFCAARRYGRTPEAGRLVAVARNRGDLYEVTLWRVAADAAGHLVLEALDGRPPIQLGEGVELLGVATGVWTPLL
jgi:transcriptional regulator with XRE-family HTH domain